MSKSPLKTTSTRPRLREAREALANEGQVPEGLVEPWLQRSWERSRAAGLSPTGRTTGVPYASARQLARARDQSRELLDLARPVMEFLFEQTRGTDSLILLADAEGMLLESLGDIAFADRAERVALRPGASWHEQWRGTNAIGTSLAERRAVVVQGGQHYLARNAFLTCAASPIIDPTGQAIGVLDISGDHREAHAHTLGLARSGARMVEHRLFETRHRHGLWLRVHPRREGLGGLTEGLLALDGTGHVIGANTVATALLQLQPGDIGGVRIESLFDLDVTVLMHWSRSTSGADLPRRLHRPDGEPLWAGVDLRPGPRATPADIVEASPANTPRGTAAPLDPIDPLDPDQVVRACNGNLSEAARRLGMSRTTLYRRLRSQ